MRTKTERRHHTTRVKARTKRKLAQWKMPVDAAAVGRAASQHNTCACTMCTARDPRDRKRSLFRDLVRLEAE